MQVTGKCCQLYSQDILSTFSGTICHLICSEERAHKDPSQTSSAVAQDELVTFSGGRILIAACKMAPKPPSHLPLWLFLTPLPVHPTTAKFLECTDPPPVSGPLHLLFIPFGTPPSLSSLFFSLSDLYCKLTSLEQHSRLPSVPPTTYPALLFSLMITTTWYAVFDDLLVYKIPIHSQLVNYILFAIFTTSPMPISQYVLK